MEFANLPEPALLGTPSWPTTSVIPQYPLQSPQTLISDASCGMKSFYRQKKSGGITKAKHSPSISLKKKASPIHDVVLGSPAAQSATILCEGKPNLRGPFILLITLSSVVLAC
uniref:Uncharacterized protein n=1 Tax=Kalanchoe fedtschenkoi TaxID=63787 RepID=A0A7N0UFY2_KALFE